MTDSPAPRLRRRDLKLGPWLLFSIALTAAGMVRLAFELPLAAHDGVWLTILVGCLWVVPVGFVAYVIVLRREGAWLASLFLIATVLRLAWGVFLFWWSNGVGWSGGIATDDTQYWSVGGRMADAVRAGVPPQIPSFGGYYVFNMLVNLVTDGNPFAVIGFNGVIGGLTLVHVYRIGRGLFGEGVGRSAAVLTAVTPELGFWSGTNLKDVHIIFAITGLTDGLVSLEKSGRASIGWLLYSTALLSYVLFMRPVFALLFLALLSVRVVSPHLTRRRAAGLATGIVVLTVVTAQAGYYPGGDRWGGLAKYADARTEISESYAGDSLSAIASPQAIRRNPTVALIGYAYALVTPFPFFRLQVVGRTAEFAAMFAGVLFWYVVLLPAGVGLVWALATRFRQTLPITWWVVLIWSAIAIETGGATFRYRASLAPFAMILAAFALRHFRGWRWAAVPYAGCLVALCGIYLVLK